MRKTAKGFTIVELLIVIVIIGVLAALVVVAYIGIQNRSTETSVQNDLRNIVNKIEVYKTDTGSYPVDTTQLDTIRTGVVQTNYDLTVGNVMYCASTGGADFRIVVRVKTGKMYSRGSNQQLTEVSPSAWTSGGTVVCPAAGISQSFWRWGYEPVGWGNPGWRLFTSR